MKLVIIIGIIAMVLLFYSIYSYAILCKKAKEAGICYDALIKQLNIEVDTDVKFIACKKRLWQMLIACFKDNPFPRVRIVLYFLRLKAVIRLFRKEKVVQTGPAAAALTLHAALAAEIATERTGKKQDTPVECDVAFAGLQVIRLYMMGYKGNEAFREERCKSGMRVNNALNGSFYKYETKDERKFSAHVYYESQKNKFIQALRLEADASRFTMDTLKQDKKQIQTVMKSYSARDLEEIAFASGACGCMLRTRSEWDHTDFGHAVNQMPLYRLQKVSDAPKKQYANDLSQGPLTGVKVLDLTHIIAGPACTRLLAEQGADVTIIRRGSFCEQEQAMLELDGWAGKKRISLDFNKEEDLEKAKQYVREADVIVSSYQYGVFDKFGLSKEDIHTLNPNVIYASMTCFSDTIWRNRPGWAPLAEDITGLSIRNGSVEKPKNLNGVPLDYIPGFLLACGILSAIKKTITEGGAYDVSASLTRAGYWLHECSDNCIHESKNQDKRIVKSTTSDYWNHTSVTVKDTAVGTVQFPTPATHQKGTVDVVSNMKFTE